MTRTVPLAASLILAVACAAALLVSSTKAAQATFPGGNGEIVFQGQYRDDVFDTELFSVNPATAKVRKLTDTPTETVDGRDLVSYGTRPRWSPDGTKVLYSLRRFYWECSGGDCFEQPYTDPDKGHTGLYTMNADGSGTAVISEGFADQFAWSPDGEKVAYATFPKERIRTVNADGYGARTVWAPKPERFGRLVEPPVWSPNGKKIAFVRETADGDSSSTYVHVVKADGTSHGKFDLRRRPGDGQVGLNWSPNGKRLIFGKGFFGGDPDEIGDIFSAKPDGSRERNLTDTPRTEEDVASEVGPRFSPDGKKIGFIRISGTGIVEDFDYSFHTMNPDGSGVEKSPFAVERWVDKGLWVWSPDSKKIAFAKEITGSGGADIFTANLDGSQRKDLNVTDDLNEEGRTDAFIRDIDWQPLP